MSDIHDIAGNEMISQLKSIGVDARWDRGGLVGACPCGADFLINFHSDDCVEIDIGIDTEEESSQKYVFYSDAEYSLKLSDPEIFQKVVNIIRDYRNEN